MCEPFLIRLGELAFVGLAVRGEDNPLAVRRIGAFCIIAFCGGEVAEFSAGEVFFVYVVGVVVAPGVTALSGGFTFLVFVLLLLYGFGVLVRGGEEDFVGGGMDPGAGGPAFSGGDAVGVAGL